MIARACIAFTAVWCWTAVGCNDPEPQPSAGGPQTARGPAATGGAPSDVSPPTKQAVSTTAGEPDTEDAPDPASEPLDMLDHYAAATRARDALIAVEPGTFRAAMQQLSGARPPGTETPPEPSQRLGRAAESALETDDPAAWARAVGEIGTHCGACHAADRGPELPPAPSPESAGDLRGHMQRHQWAVERMWEGLFVPSEPAWNAGVEILRESRLSRDDTPGAAGAGAKAAFRRLARQLQQRARQAAGAKAAERGEAFGGVLDACGDCHRRFRTPPE